MAQVELVDDLTGVTPEHAFLPNSSNATKEETETAIYNAVKTGLIAAGLLKNTSTEAEINELIKEISLDSTGKKLGIKLGNIGNKTISINLTTYAKESTFYAGNGYNTFKNTIVMVGGTGTDTDMKGTWANVGTDKKPVGKDSASAEIGAGSNVLQKTHVSYNPNTKRIKWSLKINENATPLGEVTITDKLPDYLSYVDTINFISGSFGEGDNQFSYDSETREIKITLKNVNQQRIIEFETEIDINGDVRFKDKTSVTYENKVVLTSTVNGSVTTTSSTANIKNDTLVKGAQVNKSDLEVDFTVKLNPNGMNLIANNNPEPNNLKLEDTLPNGMHLDVNSVKLYRIDLSKLSLTNSGGDYSVNLTPDKGTLIAEGNSDIISFDSVTRKLVVQIADPNAAYVLTYKAYITSLDVQLKNNVKLIGSIISENNKNEANYTAKIDSTGGAGMRLPKRFKDNFIYVGMKKVDKNNQILKGAEFELYKYTTDDQPIGKVIIDRDDGIGVLAISKSLVDDVEKLYWKETKAPVGYELSPEWHELVISKLTDDPIIVENFNKSDATNGKIKIKKTGDSGKELEGVKFELYFDSAFEIPVESVGNVATVYTTNSNGEIIFTDLYPGATYYLKEVKTVEGYILGEDPIPVKAALVTNPESEPVAQVITNVKANTTLEITKKDLGNNQVLEGAEFTLYKVLGDEPEVLEKVKSETTVSNGKITFTGLFPNSKYRLVETKAPDGYFELENAIDIKTEDNGDTISKVIHNIKKIDIKVTKEWEGGSNRLPIMVELYKNEKIIKSITLDGKESTPWEYTWTDMEDTNSAGVKHVYTVKEKQTSGSENYDITVSGNAKDGFVIKNTFVIQNTDISVEKVWINNVSTEDNLPVKFQLERKLQGESDLKFETIGSQQSVGHDEDWKYTWKDQEITNNDGIKYVYRVVEVDIPEHYRAEYSGDAETGFIVTNINSERIDIPVSKNWDDADNQDGKRPESIRVNLLADGKQVATHNISQNDDWEYTFNVYKYNQETGQEIEYSVTEDTVKDYSTSINGYEITNKYTPGKTSVTVTKAWNDRDNLMGLRPDSIEVQLLANGKQLDKPVVLSEENNWTTTWDELDEKEKGESIAYSVAEISEMKQYETTINDKNHGNIIITNSYKFPPISPTPDPEPTPDPTPTPGEPTPTPGEPTPTPGVPSPTPGVPSPTPGVPMPTPGEPTPTPGEPTPTPGEATPTPGVPSPTPGVPSPTPGVPTPTPGVPSPTPGKPTPTPEEPTPTPGIPPTYELTEVPDPNDPDSPDVFILIDENGVPLGTYTKVKQSDGSYLYIGDNNVPLGTTIQKLPKTGEEELWGSYLFGIVMALMGYMALISKRKKETE